MCNTGTIGMTGAIGTIIGVTVIVGTSEFACTCGTDISYSVRFATAAGAAGSPAYRDMNEGGGKSAALIFLSLGADIAPAESQFHLAAKFHRRVIGVVGNVRPFERAALRQYRA